VRHTTVRGRGLIVLSFLFATTNLKCLTALNICGRTIRWPVQQEPCKDARSHTLQVLAPQMATGREPRNLCFRRTDDQSQHECQAGEIRQATNRTRSKQLVLIFFFARVRQHSNRLSDENVSSLTVSECWNGRFKCSHVELCHRARECVFDELVVCYEIPNQRCEFIQILEQQEAPRCALR